MLKKTAVPNIFNLPPHLLKKTGTARLTQARSVSDPFVSSSAPSHSPLAQPYGYPQSVPHLCSVFMKKVNHVGSVSIPSDPNTAIVIKDTAEECHVADSILQVDIVMIDANTDVTEVVSSRKHNHAH